MIKTNLSSVLELFKDDVMDHEEREELFNEAVLMTLARATSVDTNIRSVEIDTVQKIIQSVTGEEVSPADIRVAANSQLFEDAPLDRYLWSVGKNIDTTAKLTIINALSDVIKADREITWHEVAFVNMVADAFALRPSDLLGLTARS